MHLRVPGLQEARQDHCLLPVPLQREPSRLNLDRDKRELVSENHRFLLQIFIIIYRNKKNKKKMKKRKKSVVK